MDKKVEEIYFDIPELQRDDYQIIDTIRIYEKIQQGEALQLSNVMIKGLSIAEYRKLYHIPENAEIEVYIDYITNCVFCTSDRSDNIILDLSYCILRADDPVAGILLDNNIFYNGNIDFSYSKVYDYDLSMTGCTFIKSELFFNFTTFGNGDLYLNKTHFYRGRNVIHFIGTDFGSEGEITFEYMKNIMQGLVEFYKCSFGENMLNFAYMKCPECQFLFWDLETSNIPIDFVDSSVRMIILYKVNTNGVLDFRILTAEDIIIQESVIRDCILLGNQGYRNYTSYCFKKSTLLGRIKIQNKFSKKLFRYQKQLVCDTRLENNEFFLCQTSATDKANQLTVLAENYHSEGEADNEDRAYVLSKRYRSLGRVHDNWADYGAVGRTEEYQSDFIRRIIAYIEITIKLIGASMAWLFEKVFLDILCGNYATKPSKFLFWIIVIVTGFAIIYTYCIGIDSNNFILEHTIYNNMNSWVIGWLYSLQIFLQIDNGELIPKIPEIYYIMVIEKIIGLSIFSIFVVSYTRKVIK